MQINSAEELFQSELIDIYNAEQRLCETLPQLTQSVHADKVRQCLEERVQQGKTLLQNMDQIFEQMNISKQQQANPAVDGLINKTQILMGEIQADQLKDSALIGSVQKIEHYCIAAWGTAAALGRQLNRQPAVDTFERALSEGKEFDKQMTDLAENQINPAAGQTKH